MCFRVVLFLLLAAALPAVSEVARAQSYPERPVRLIARGLPGDVADLFASLYGEWLALGNRHRSLFGKP
jgi:tripartite-type tricarboxylate transporter receptor subunit TctC